MTGNFSKYIPFGAVRADIRSDDGELKPLYFYKDGKNIVILINDTEKEKTVSFPDGLFEKAVLAVTNEKEDLEEHTINKTDIKISARSVNTIIF